MGQLLHPGGGGGGGGGGLHSSCRIATLHPIDSLLLLTALVVLQVSRPSSGLRTCAQWATLPWTRPTPTAMAACSLLLVRATLIVASQGCPFSCPMFMPASMHKHADMHARVQEHTCMHLQTGRHVRTAAYAPPDVDFLAMLSPHSQWHSPTQSDLLIAAPLVHAVPPA